MANDMHNVWQVFFRLVLCLFTVIPVASAQSGNSAVILIYHNVSTGTPASTSVSTETFTQHMNYLVDNQYTVWPLFKTLQHLATGKTIPAKTVVLTFDDAYQSVYQQALPVLKEKGWPFTVFVTTQYIGEGYSNFMSWQQLREIRQSGGEIGNHSLSHPHFIRRRNAESDEQWRARIIDEIQQAQTILQQNAVSPILALAYPYGEYSKAVKQLVRELGYFGIGQHSGAVSSQTDFQAVPRFPMTAGFDDMENFVLKVASKNLPVTVLSPDDGVISNDVAIPILSIRLEAGDYDKSGLRCYATGQGSIQHEWITDDNSVVKISANRAIEPGRTKYNCTAPSASEADVYYWFSFLWMKQEEAGWYKE